jgi:hypothetical protein
MGVRRQIRPQMVVWIAGHLQVSKEKFRCGGWGVWLFLEDSSKPNPLTGSSEEGPLGAMSILSWNCHGLGQSVTIHELIALVRAKSPIMIFLMETRRSASRAMNLKWMLGLKNSVGVDNNCQGGGIVLFWHESVEVIFLGMSHRFIDIRVKYISTNLWYRLTFIYGEHRVESHHLMWETLRRLKSVSDLPWLVLGDFNEIMWGYEHYSDTP